MNLLFDAVFLDRDGTINVKPPEGSYVTSASELHVLSGAAEAIRLLNALEIPVIVVTNQRGIARGLMSEDALAAVHQRMHEELANERARIDAFYHCPHEIGECTCRKPQTGMFERARRDRPEIVLDRTAVIGDSPSDIEAGKRIGAVTALITHNAEPSGPRHDQVTGADREVRSLLDAVRWLVTCVA